MGNITLNLQIAATADDGYSYNAGTTFVTDALSLGRGSESQQRLVWLRFVNVLVPHGLRVVSAKTSLYATDDDADTPELTIYGNASDDAVAPTDAAERRALVKTAASVDWDPGAVTEETWYDSPDIKSVIQEIVDRPDWKSGQSIQILVENRGTVADQIQAFEDSTAKLQVVFYDPFVVDEPGYRHVNLVEYASLAEVPAGMRTVVGIKVSATDIPTVLLTVDEAVVLAPNEISWAVVYFASLAEFPEGYKRVAVLT
jgi:hypothetical protein